jgi:hypothetical protein
MDTTCTKNCPACERDLPQAAFHLDRARRGGLSRLCRSCGNARRSQRRTGARALSRATGGPLVRRMVCSVCDAKEAHGARSELDLDVPGGSGPARGLLCAKCASALGGLDHDPARALRALSYLQRSCARQVHAEPAPTCDPNIARWVDSPSPLA